MKETEVGNKSQESGRVVHCKKEKAEQSKWDMQTAHFQRRGWKNKENEEGENGRASVRENETIKILIKIKMPAGSFRKSAQLFKNARSDQPQH